MEFRLSYIVNCRIGIIEKKKNVIHLRGIWCITRQIRQPIRHSVQIIYVDVIMCFYVCRILCVVIINQ